MSIFSMLYLVPLFSVFCGILCFVKSQKHLLNTLLSLEYVMLSVFWFMSMMVVNLGGEGVFLLFKLIIESYVPGVPWSVWSRKNVLKEPQVGDPWASGYEGAPLLEMSLWDPWINCFPTGGFQVCPISAVYFLIWRPSLL